MTAPISNGPATTRLHHYAGHYWVAARFLVGAWGMLSNFARNSPLSRSNIELASLELQRFWRILKSDRDKLRAKFVW